MLSNVIIYLFTCFFSKFTKPRQEREDDWGEIWGDSFSTHRCSWLWSFQRSGASHWGKLAHVKFFPYLALCSSLLPPFWSCHFTRLIFLCDWFLFDHCIMAGGDWKCVIEAANICWFRKILLSPLHTCYKHLNNRFESNWRKNKVSRSNCWCTFLQVIWDKHMICVCVCVF